MGIDESRIDLDRKPLELVENAYSLSKDYQTVRNEQYMDEYKLYHGYINAADRDPDRANIFIPKIFSIVETKAPRDTKALFGTRPYIPFTARRPEFRQSSKIQTKLLDEYLDRGGFFLKGALATKLKIAYGTSFMDAIPYYETIKEKYVVPEVVAGVVVGNRIDVREVQRLRFRITTYAPWEVYVDPFAKGLEERGQCQYVIKVMLVRLSEIVKMAQAGMYPGLDLDLVLDNKKGSQIKSEHWGIQMMADMGLNSVDMDDGVGVLLRFESDERYIDVWNGQTVLRDITNPFDHGMPNLSRFLHIQDINSQNAFWGIGEIKQNEILQHMLNDSWNLTFDAHNMNNHGITYYRKGEVNPDALVRTVGNKIGIDTESDRPVRDLVYESFGQPLPQDHYAIPNTVERMMDLTSGSFALQRGEESSSGRTATENALRKEFGDLRQELNVRLGEKSFMKSFGEKMLSMVDQFANMGDIVEIVGEEDAQKMIGVNPNDLPGGFNFTFKGADKVANELIEQRNWKEVVPLLQQSPNVLQGKLATLTLEKFNVDDDKDLEMVIPDEQMFQMQQQAQQEEIIQIEAQAQRDHERDMELARLQMSMKEKSGNAMKDNNRKAKGKGIQHSEKPKVGSVKSEARSQAREQIKR